jgi:hypothetical protein
MPERSRSIDELLAGARGRLVRLSPQEAYRAQQAGGVLVDIRPRPAARPRARCPAVC